MNSNSTQNKSGFLIAALYKFVDFHDFADLQAPLLAACIENQIMGTILLAPEGINGTIAGPEDGIRKLLHWLRRQARFEELEAKFSRSEMAPFYRMKVRLKKEIVTLGVDGIDPVKHAGTYVQPEHWNDLIGDPNVIVIDTRNDYEVAIGTFQGAQNPQTSSFRDLPGWVEQKLKAEPKTKIAMFCTGGIRCEKSTALLKSKGFENVYHLKGGILKYLEQVPENESLWQGDCFVFDQRVSVKHGLEVGNYDMCHACRMPIDEADMASTSYVKGVSCPHCIDTIASGQRARFSERQRQMELAKARNEVHIAADIAVAKATKRAAKEAQQERSMGTK